MPRLAPKPVELEERERKELVEAGENKTTIMQ